MSFAANAFGYLHRETVRSFGGDTKMWVESVSGSNVYDTPLDVATGAVSGRNAEARGMTMMPADEVAVHVSAEYFPDGVRPNTVFLLGPACEDGGPARSCRKYMTTGVDRAPDYQSHYRIRAERQ